MKTLEVIAVIIEGDRGRYFIAQRLKEKALGDLWEFPGGRLEPGETHEQCAYREIEVEEFPGVEIRITKYLGESVYLDQLNNTKIRLFGYHAVHISGEFRPTEHQRVAFVHPHEFSNYRFAPADNFFIRKLTA